MGSMTTRCGDGQTHERRSLTRTVIREGSSFKTLGNSHIYRFETFLSTDISGNMSKVPVALVVPTRTTGKASEHGGDV